MQIKPGLYSVFFSSFFKPNLLFTFSMFQPFPPSYISTTALILVMAADSFTLPLKAEKNLCGDNAQIERSLLSAFHHIKRACIRDTTLSVVWHIAEVNLNQHLLSGVSPQNPAMVEFQFYFSRDKLPTNIVICYPNKANRHHETETSLTIAPYQ